MKKARIRTIVHLATLASGFWLGHVANNALAIIAGVLGLAVLAVLVQSLAEAVADRYWKT